MRNQLMQNEFLERNTPNDTLTSTNREFKLVMQDDGNLVLSKGGSAIWSTKTVGTDGKKATMQPDGNFVVSHVNGTPVWNSQTHGKPGAYLILQDDGNLVIYPARPPALWHSNPAH